MKASVEHIREKFAFTERRACRLLLVPVSSYRYKPRQNDNSLRERLIVLAREKPRFGYRRLHVLLGREGEQVNHKRVHRIYREAGLALRRKKRKHCVRVSTPLAAYTAPNQEWALDFVHDAVASGRSIRVLNVIDAFTRESLAMEVDTSFAGLRVTRVLEQIIAERGLPRAIRCDNGPELTSRHSALPCLGPGPQDRPGAHPAGQAHAERLRGEFQQQDARGVPARQLVPEPVRSQEDHRRLASRLQRTEAP